MSVSGFTFGLQWRSPAVQPQDYRSKRHESLHTVLPDGVDDGGREVDVEVTKKHDAVVILRENEEGKARKRFIICSCVHRFV